MSVIERAKKHLQQMAPHVKRRESARIIVDLLAELERGRGERAALTRWAKAKNGLNDAIDSCDPDECDHWHDEIAAAEKALLDQLKETDDDDNA